MSKCKDCEHFLDDFISSKVIVDAYDGDCIFNPQWVRVDRNHYCSQFKSKYE